MSKLPLVLVLAPFPAWGGGYYYPDSGTVANGRGCAWVAGADTYFAQYYNPAGLVNVPQPEVAIGGTGIRQSVTFTRLEDPPWDPATNVDPDPYFLPASPNEGAFFAVPEIGFATPIGEDFAFAFGFTSGFAPDYKYAEDGPQRYTMIDSLIWNFSIGPTLAWQPVEQVAIGLGLQWQVLRVEERLKVCARNGPCAPDAEGNDFTAGDVVVDASVWDAFTPGFNAGVLVTPVEQVSIGVAVQPPANYRGRGDGQLDFTGNGLEPSLDQAVWTDDDITLDLQMPLFLKTGVAVRPAQGLEIEAGFFYETWSRLEDILVGDIDVTVTGLDGAINEPVQESIALPAGFEDVWSVRLGGEYRATELLEVRAGGFYEKGSLPPNEISAALVDTDKVQGGAGLSLYLPGQLVIDGSLSLTSYRKLEIRNSEVTQINVFDPTQQAVVGNGDMSSWGLAVGGALRKRFGRPPGKASPDALAP